MKIVTSDEMTRIEKLAYAAGASEAVFMENAGRGASTEILKFFAYAALFPRKVMILCGKGNNTGDGFVCGRYLLQKGFEVVAMETVANEDEYSPLAKDHLALFEEEGGTRESFMFGQQVEWDGFAVLIDALLGTGLQGEVRELYADLIRQANGSGLPIFAIDIPSGLCGNTGKVLGEAIRASETVYLGLPKIGYFLGDGWEHVGRLSGVDFGLEESFISQAESSFDLVQKGDRFLAMPKINPSRHKYEAGFATLVGGSKTIFGAPLMASEAALKTGAGMVHLFYPDGAAEIPLKAPLPLMASPFSKKNLEEIISKINQSRGVAIGMGLGTSPDAKVFFAALIEKIQVPVVLDADALNLFAENDQIQLPSQTLLTPHMGEMKRLLGKAVTPKISPEFLKECRDYAQRKGVMILLKTFCYIFISPKEETLQIVAGGNPGIAKGGSGDVLSGMIVSLIAQGMDRKKAALLAANLQVVSGDLAAKEKTAYGMTPLDLIEKIPEAIKAFLPHYA